MTTKPLFFHNVLDKVAENSLKFSRQTSFTVRILLIMQKLFIIGQFPSKMNTEQTQQEPQSYS